MNKLVSGAIGVEVKLKPGLSKIFLPDVIDLRNKRIKHIDFLTSSTMFQAPSGANLTTVGDQLFITLVEQNTQRELIKSMPATELNFGKDRKFINKIIDLQKSYIDMSGVGNPVNITDKSVYLVFWFDEPRVWGVMNDNAKTCIEPIEITLVGLKTFFGENKNLTNKSIQNLLLSYPTISPKGKAGISGGTDNKFITLQRKGLKFFSQVPLVLFYQQTQNYALRLQNIKVDWQYSYIESITAGVDDLKTVFLNAVIDDVHHNR